MLPPSARGISTTDDSQVHTVRRRRSDSVTVHHHARKPVTLERYRRPILVLRLAVLGHPVVESGGASVSFDTRKSVALLALLVVARSPRSRAGLTAMLWPDSDESRARSSLRRTLSVTAAGVGDALDISRTTVALDPSRAWCDLWEFERLAEKGDADSLAAAAALYRDDFLAGFDARAGVEFDHWQELVAEEQRQRLSPLLSRLVEMRISMGDLDGALADCRRWVSLDELHEPAHRALMRALARNDQRTAALSQYRRCVRVLEEELGVEPLAETTALYEEIRRERFASPSAPSVGLSDEHGESDDEQGEKGEDKAAAGGPAEHRAHASLGLIGQGEIVDSLVVSVEASTLHGRVAVVAGPAGSGKTSIVDALHARVDDSAWVAARCHPEEHWLELGCVTDLLRSAFAQRSDLAEVLSPDDKAEVARLLPELAGRPASDAQPVGSPGAQVRFFRSISATLACALGNTLPGVLFVDDVQHVDEASARLLAYLVRRVDDLSALIVFTCQPEIGLSPVLAAALREASRRGEVEYYEPRMLDAAEVAAVLTWEGAEGADPEELVRQTGGLPLLVLAYADNLRRSQVENQGAGKSGERPGDATVLADVPITARQLLAERMSRVSQTTSQVISAAAVLGSDCDAELLRATSGRSSEEVADALDEALRFGLLVESPPVRGVLPTYDFPYDALKRVAYEECGSARRRLLHGRTADALARAAKRPGGDALSGTVASHLDSAGRGVEAAEWSWRAAQRSLSLYAHAEAVDHLRRALELGYPPAEAHAAIADAMIALGSYRGALVELEKAAAAAEPGTGEGSDDTKAAIEHTLAAVHERLGNWPVAAAHIDAALDLCQSNTVLRARVLADRALIAYRRCDPEADEMSRVALEAAAVNGDPRALVPRQATFARIEMTRSSSSSVCRLRQAM